MDEYEQLCDDLTAPLTECDRIHDELNVLTSNVRQGSYTVGADAQNKITALVLQTELLARASAELLTQFNQPRYTSMPRRTGVLESMHTLVRDTAQASLAFTTALRNNPLPADVAPALQPAAAPQAPLLRRSTKWPGTWPTHRTCWKAAPSPAATSTTGWCGTWT